MRRSQLHEDASSAASGVILVTADHLAGRPSGGIGTYCSALLSSLAAHDPRPAVRVRTASGQEPPVAFAWPQQRSRFNIRLLTAAWDRGLAGPGRGVRVIHATSLATPAPGPVPLTVMVHDLAWRHVPEAYPARGREWHEAALRRAKDRAGVMIVPAPSTGEELVADGVSPDRVRVILHGSDHLPPPNLGGAALLLHQRGVDGPYLCAVSTFEPRQNLARLIEAYAQVRHRLPEPWPLVIAGPRGWGPEVTPCDGVVLLGPVDEPILAALYAGASLTASVPMHEGWGFPAVEAMAAGCPVVASPLPSVGDAALIVDPGSVDSIAQGLLAVAGDEAVRAPLVARGRRRAKHLRWADSAAKHLAVWDELTPR